MIIVMMIIMMMDKCDDDNNYTLTNNKYVGMENTEDNFPLIISLSMLVLHLKFISAN